MDINDFEIVENVKDFYTFYFIESHFEHLNNETELIVDTSHKCMEPLKKIYEKKLTDLQKKQVYIVSVYGIVFRPNFLKKKEIKHINGQSCFSIKLILKCQKNKFESKNYVSINCDTFVQIKFDILKKIFSKNIDPPEQMQLTTFEMIQIFNDALLIKEKKTVDDATFIELLKFCVNQLKKLASIELNLYYLIYINILNCPNSQLIKEILDLFIINKLKKPLNSKILDPYIEKMEILYNEQHKVFKKLLTIPKGNININTYLNKFYTVHIYMYGIIENYETCEKIMIDLRDNNLYDKDILAKLYLSEFSEFYRSIPISIDLQNSLMGKFINISNNYNELVNAFFAISTFTKKDFANILLVITQNFDKIYPICKNNNSPLKIIDFIRQSPQDNLNQIQNYLDFITNQKLEKNFKSIDISLNIWDFYLSNGNNRPFLEYLKNNLIIGSIAYGEIIQRLSYLTKYTNKNFIETLDLIVKHYAKIRSLCMNERKQIVINDFIKPSVNDNPDKIKEYLSYIVSEKLKDQYQTVFFNIDIWNFYIFNHYENEFLSFLEMKLYESALNSKEILDCLTFSMNFTNKNFFYMIEKILFNFDKIQSIFKNEKICIDIKNYIVQKPNDDLYKIYEIIEKIIQKELFNKHCSIKFSVDLWALYSETQSLDIVQFIKKIINECKKMQPELDVEKIKLSSKIHNNGFYEIQNGIINSEKLLKFLGEDEIFYVDKRINQFMEKNKNFVK